MIRVSGNTTNASFRFFSAAYYKPLILFVFIPTISTSSSDFIFFLWNRSSISLSCSFLPKKKLISLYKTNHVA